MTNRDSFHTGPESQRSYATELGAYAKRVGTAAQDLVTDLPDDAFGFLCAFMAPVVRELAGPGRDLAMRAYGELGDTSDGVYRAAQAYVDVDHEQTLMQELLPHEQPSQGTPPHKPQEPPPPGPPNEGPLP